MAAGESMAGAWRVGRPWGCDAGRMSEPRLTAALRRRWLVACAGAALAAGLVAGLGGASAQASTPTRPASWSVAPQPVFAVTGGTAAPLAAVRDWLAVGSSRTTWLADDGNVIMRSTDQGRDWTESFNVVTALAGGGAAPDLGMAEPYAAPYYIANVTSPRYPGNGNDVYAQLLPNSDYSLSGAPALGLSYLVVPDPPTLFAVSHDAGQSWTIEGLGTQQLSSVSWPHCKQGLLGESIPALVVAPTNSKVLYLVNCSDYIGFAAAIEAGSGNALPGNLMFRSTDGGASWSAIPVAANAPYLVFTAGELPLIQVDPRSTSTLWAIQSQSVTEGKNQIHVLTVFRSKDSGATWSTYATPIRAISDEAVYGFDLYGTARSTEVLLWSADHGVVATDAAHPSAWHQIGKFIKGGPLYTGAIFLPVGGNVLVGTAANAEGNDATLSPSCGSVGTLKVFGFAGRAVAQVQAPSSRIGRLADAYPLLSVPGPSRGTTELFVHGDFSMNAKNSCAVHPYGQGVAPGLVVTMTGT